MLGDATSVVLVDSELEREKGRAALDVGAALALRWWEEPNEGVVVPGRLVVEKLGGLVTLESGGRMPEAERTARPWA